MKNTFLRLFAGLALASPLFAQDTTSAPQGLADAPAEPAAETDPAVIKSDTSYGFGFEKGMQFKQMMESNGLILEDIDNERFCTGFIDALAGKDVASDQLKLKSAMLGLRNIVKVREEKIAEENLAKANAFLEENKGREGVTTTESGLQYEVITKGEGAVYDGTIGAQFMVNYKGTLIDGTQFDASPEGSPVPLNLEVIPGISEALSTMPVGSKWKIYLKPDLAYASARRSQLIAPNTALIFELELVEIKNPQPAPKAVSQPVQIPPAPTQPQE